MVNLTNFLESQPTKEAEKITRSSAEFTEWKKLRRICNSFLRQGFFVGGDYNVLSQPEKEIVQREERIIENLWCKNKFLPAEMVDSALGVVREGNVLPYRRKMSPLVAFSALPKTRLSNIRNAAEKLSLAIVPYEYTNPDGIVAKYAKEGQREYALKVKEGFEGVNELSVAVSAWEKVELYILCPIGFYDVWQEVKDTSARQKFFGGELSMASMMLGVMMPAQKNLYQMSKTNAENIEILNSTMKENFVEVQKTMNNMQGQISWLHDEVSRVRRMAANAARMANKVQGAVNSLRDETHLATRAGGGGEVFSTVELKKKEGLFRDIARDITAYGGSEFGIASSVDNSSMGDYTFSAPHCSETVKMNTKTAKLERVPIPVTAGGIAACSDDTLRDLDSLIFALPKGTDLLKEDVDARLMMCFGVDMPLDFFLRRGLVQVENCECYKPILRILQ